MGKMHMVKFSVHPNAIVESTKIGKNSRIWAFAHICKDVRVGKDCNIGEGCYIESGVKLGNVVTVKNGVCLWKGVEVQDKVFIGPNAVFTNEMYPRSKRYGALCKTVVKKGSAIGANATIVCGISVGKYAMVGAGAVVTKNVADYTLVYGNPAVFKGYVCRCGDKLTSEKGGMFRCRCGLVYSVRKNGALRESRNRA